uniref:RING-type domain-containing protein n=1 Tax=Oncorhynchus kisutch TaxID=8019 RepID=A0A8C7CW65_ONCKI
MNVDRSLLPEEQCQCYICLNVFIDPVTSPYGHTFCKACIGGHWDDSEICQCPKCKKRFYVKPEVSTNTVKWLVMFVLQGSSRMCKKHKRLLELFCRSDQNCVYVLCAETGHKCHNTVPIEEGVKQKGKKCIRFIQSLFSRSLLKEKLKAINNLSGRKRHT